ncbi:MAG: DUF4282 domain-containing protein [Beutenbergiaceae bacterium]
MTMPPAEPSQPPQPLPEPNQAPQPAAGQTPPPAAGYYQPPSAASGPAAQPTGGPYPAQPGYGPPPAAGGLRSAFDFTFNSYATPGIVKVLYIIGIALAVLGYIINVIMAFIVGGLLGVAMDPLGNTSDISSVLLGMAGLLLGWIPALFGLLMLRVGLEVALSNVRSASDVQLLRQRSDADAAES